MSNTSSRCCGAKVPAPPLPLRRPTSELTAGAVPGAPCRRHPEEHAEASRCRCAQVRPPRTGVQGGAAAAVQSVCRGSGGGGRCRHLRRRCASGGPHCTLGRCRSWQARAAAGPRAGRPRPAHQQDLSSKWLSGRQRPLCCCPGPACLSALFFNVRVCPPSLAHGCPRLLGSQRRPLSMRCGAWQAGLTGQHTARRQAP